MPVRPSLRIANIWRPVVEGLFLVLAIYTLINLTTVRFVVDGISMSPTFETGQYIVVDRTVYLYQAPQRGDIVVFHSPVDVQRDFIKRVIGLPGETIEFRATQVYVNGVRLDEPYLPEICDVSVCGDAIWQLGDDEYFVMGDNRNLSSDSRFFGAISLNDIVGQAMFRYYPLSQVKWLV